MATAHLVDLAHARSGDKGDVVNIGVIAYEPEDYPLLAEVLTAKRVQEHFGDLVKGRVIRYELPRLHALNFVLPRALGGGGTVSLMMDAQGKVFSTALLRMELEVPEETARRVRGRGRAPASADPNREKQARVNAGETPIGAENTDERGGTRMKVEEHS